MYQFVESIRVQDGAFKLLDYHQQRLDRTTKNYFDQVELFDLKRILSDVERPVYGEYKCRFLYGKDGFNVEYNSYHPKKVSSMKLVNAGDYSYEYKSLNRTYLEELFNLRSEADDVIIINRELEVTDSYYANLAFYDGDNWFTPKSYLLSGVKRQYLIDQGLLIEKVITKDDIWSYQKLSLINAMLDLGVVEIKIDQIVEN